MGTIGRSWDSHRIFYPILTYFFFFSVADWKRFSPSLILWWIKNQLQFVLRLFHGKASQIISSKKHSRGMFENWSAIYLKISKSSNTLSSLNWNTFSGTNSWMANWERPTLLTWLCSDSHLAPKFRCYCLIEKLWRYLCWRQRCCYIYY